MNAQCITLQRLPDGCVSLLDTLNLIKLSLGVYVSLIRQNSSLGPAQSDSEITSAVVCHHKRFKFIHLTRFDRDHSIIDY